MKPAALILCTAGTNCDRELVYAFELAGAAARAVHLNDLIAHPAMLEEFDLIGFPGGFSYGDDIAAGRIMANRLRHRLFEPLLAALARGVPMIGVCNGFQTLVKLGLLPDPPGGMGVSPVNDSDILTQPRESSAPKPQSSSLKPIQTATLADNLGGRFIDRWVKLQTVADSVCIWTKNLPRAFDLPIAHGEGRLVPASPEYLARWQAAGQIALRYDPADNPNGSTDGIAGVCDPSGLVLGLMPHPERNTHPTHHPDWTRRTAEELAMTPVGLRFFQNAVEHVRQRTPVSAG